MHMSFRVRRVLMGALLLSAWVLTGCEKPTVDVNLHGVDYSDREFSYYVVDPANPSNVAGEHIDPFAAGGTTCCFPLPRKWHPGIKVQIRTTHWLPKRPDGSLPEVNEEHLVEVPRYADGTPGELWVIRGADGAISVISSDFQPDHPKWPGMPKGWPVPSLEYRRERWELFRKHEEEGVELYQSFLKKFKDDPYRESSEAWVYAKENHPDTLKDFTGPNDPRYRAALKKEYDDGLVRSQKQLRDVLEAKP